MVVAGGARRGGAPGRYRYARLSFTLFVEGIDLRDDDQVDALFEAGCGDALVGLVDGAGRLDFDREAASLEEAVLSAVEDIESVDGAKAVRVADVGPALTPAQRTAAAEPGLVGFA